MHPLSFAELAELSRERGRVFVPPSMPGHPDDIEWLFVGEAPARDEERRGRPFTGASGQVLWQMASRALGAHRGNSYVTNLVKHRLLEDWEEDGVPQAEIERWGTALSSELSNTVRRASNLRAVIALGRYSASYLSPEEFLSMEAGNGRPHRCSLPGIETIYPVVHPAAGLHQTEMLATTMLGLQEVQASLDGKSILRQDRHPQPRYKRLRGTFQPSPAARVAIDTEGSPDYPWCFSFSIAPGEAFIIYAEDEEAIGCFIAWLKRHRPSIIFHSALYDLAVLRAMGIDIIRLGLKIHDTMVLSYVGQKYPRGLKPLSYRLHGMRMSDYHDVVQPHDDRVTLSYLEEVRFGRHRWPAGVGRKWGIEKLVHGVLYPRGKGEPKAPRKRWEEFDPALRAPVEKKLGPLPPLSPHDIPAKELTHYAARDADATQRDFRTLWKLTKADPQQRAVYNLDMAVTPMVDRMQAHGLPILVYEMKKFRGELIQSMESTRAFIAASIGKPSFNPNSSDQCAEFLFQTLKLPITKLTKKGKKPSTDDKVLQALASKHPIIPWIADYREDLKLRGILDGIEKRTKRLKAHSGHGFSYDEFDWLFYNLRTTTVVSGRLSANDPNVLALPTKTEKGRRVRSCFVAPPGYVFLSVDLSQIELRVMAHEARDRAMIDAFLSGEDIHWKTAKLMFGHANSLIYDESNQDHFIQRYAAKTLNFAILYGISADGLQKQFALAGIFRTVTQCQELIDGWLGAYAGVCKYMEAAIREGLRYGYVREPGGRLRYLPALRLDGNYWPFNYLRGEAERQATNHKIQGGAQTIIKRAMVIIWREVLPAFPGLQCMLQIHDELLFLCPERKARKVSAAVIAAMTSLEAMGGVEMEVPLIAKGTWGPSWGSLKK